MCIYFVAHIQVAVSSGSIFHSPSASNTNVASTMTKITSPGGRLLNFVKNAVGSLLPTAVLNRSLSPFSGKTPPTTDKDGTDKSQPLNQSAYVI